MKAFKITFSGSYKASNNDVFGFENLEVTVPYQEIDVALMHARARHLPMALAVKLRQGGGEVSLKAIKQIRESFDDSMEEIEYEFSFENKDIRSLTFEEIQDVALMYDLREVPAYKVGSLRHQLNVLYGIYSTLVLKNKIDYKAEYFNVVDLPPIYIGGTSRVSREMKATFKQEDGPQDIPTDSLEALKKIADSKGIKYHHRVGYDKLYEQIYGVDNASEL